MVNDLMPGFGADQLTRMLEGFKLPGLDIKALMQSQQRNMEALAQATQVAAQGVTEIAQKQAEILRSAVGEAMSMAGNLKAGDASATAKAQQEYLQRAFETAVTNARELAEMVGRSNREAYQVIEGRMKESLEEIRSVGQGKGITASF